MFKFGKRKRYSIGEKITYFTKIKNDKTATKNKKDWADLRLSNLKKQKDNIKIGDVFIVNDKKFGNNEKKPRLCVVAKANKYSVHVIPVFKSKKLMSLSKFDEQRSLSFNNSKELSKTSLYSKRGFKIAKNAYLTTSEKKLLHRKSEKYLQ